MVAIQTFVSNQTKLSLIDSCSLESSEHAQVSGYAQTSKHARASEQTSRVSQALESDSYYLVLACKVCANKLIAIINCFHTYISLEFCIHFCRRLLEQCYYNSQGAVAVESEPAAKRKRGNNMKTSTLKGTYDSIMLTL